MTDLVIGMDPGKTMGLCGLLTEPDGRWQLIYRHEYEYTLMETELTLRVFFGRAGIQPSFVAVERPFLVQGDDTLFAAMQTGVALLVAEREGAQGKLYYPATIRRLVTGSGSAKDADVARLIRELLGISRNPGKSKGLGKHQPAAIAVALACAVEECGAVLERRVETA